MKNFTLMMFALLCSLMSFAQGGQTTFTWAAENGGFDDQAVVAEFNVTVELYAHSAEDRDYFNNMDFAYQDNPEGWVEKVIEYRNGLAGYKKLSDIIG